MTPKEYFVILQERFPLFEWTEYKPPDGYEYCYEGRGTYYASIEGKRVLEVWLWQNGMVQVDAKIEICGSPEAIADRLALIQEIVKLDLL
jgi:hypothetical protein